DALCKIAGMLQRHLFPPGGPVKIIADTTNDDYRKMFDVSVFGTLTVTRTFVQPMIAQKSGSIFTVISSGALMKAEGGAYVLWRPNSREQPYQAAKSAIANIMCYMGDELQEDNVAVNAFVPAHTRSTGFDEWREARVVGRGSGGPTPYHPDHVQPLGNFLAQQDGRGGNTAKIWVANSWLVEHGYGPMDKWLCPDDDIWAAGASGSWSTTGFE
ncbi:MAG: SDR family NAD(P)-dependent oxidoreductase, partial [Chloroflexi bacterium]|nr:SDR family NAD(P)-dependent oxidoreductase [Chloroflexota bacterium]